MADDTQKRTDGKYVAGQVIMVILALGIAFYIAVFVPGKPMEKLVMVVGYALLVLTFLFGMVILVDIFRGRIDLSAILSEDGKGASMSRFQLLIFTFVIALSLFLLVVQNAANGKGFPAIPADVLTLLGISASTYAVSKGIQAGSQSNQNGQPAPTNQPNPATHTETDGRQ
jgi:amino acid transporter